MNGLTVFLLTILAFILIGWTFQAVRLIPEYKTGIYRELYGSFLAFFWRTCIRQDASESGYLKREIGTSRILFSKFDQNGKTMARFCTILYQKGIFVICYQATTGAIRGGHKDKDWVVTKKDKNGESRSFRHPNPTKYLEAYLRRIASIFPDRHLETRISFPDALDFSALKSDIALVHNSDLIEEMKNVKGEFISDEEVKADFQKASGENR
jgi:hypothetical protein